MASDDRVDVAPGFAANTETGAFKMFDAQGNGLYCDGDGNVTISNSTDGSDES